MRTLKGNQERSIAQHSIKHDLSAVSASEYTDKIKLSLLCVNDGEQVGLGFRTRRCCWFCRSTHVLVHIVQGVVIKATVPVKGLPAWGKEQRSSPLAYVDVTEPQGRIGV